MQSGLCPKCGRDKVYRRENLPLATSLALPPTAAFNAPLHSYLCTHCGYSEIYTAGAKLVDSSSLAAAMIADGQWQRVDTGVRPENRLTECRKCGARLHGERCECGSNNVLQPTQ